MVLMRGAWLQWFVTLTDETAVEKKIISSVKLILYCSNNCEMKNACLSVDDTKCFVNKIIFKEEVVIIICDSFIMTPCINELRPPPLPSYHHPDSITTSSQYKQPRVTSTHVSSHTCIIILSPPVSFSLLPSQFLRNKSIHVWQYHSHINQYQSRDDIL